MDAGTAALLKALTTVAEHGPGVVLTQLAYQAGSLAASLPPQPVALGSGIRHPADPVSSA